VSIIPVLIGERAEIRLLHKTQRIARLEELGFSQKSFDAITQASQAAKGASSRHRPIRKRQNNDRLRRNKCYRDTRGNVSSTVEDPVEYKLPYASQVQLPSDRSFNFADALRAILRQNPNVILIGEIRDAETGIVAF